MLALRRLTPAPLPAVVFSSLAAVSVPTLSDRCRVVIAEEGLESYLIERPLRVAAREGSRPENRGGPATGGAPVGRDDTSGRLSTVHTVRTPFLGTPIPGQPGYQGIVVHLWDHGYRPTPAEAELAQLAVTQAVDLVHEQRMASRTGTRAGGFGQPGPGLALLTALLVGRPRPGPSRRPAATPRLVAALPEIAAHDRLSS